MNRDVNSIIKEIDWNDFFNKTNKYKIELDLNIKTWNDFILKFFPNLVLFNSSLLEDKQLTSLEGSPQEMDGHFDCSDNYLTSLKGSPQKINGTFDCRCNKLTSLEGGPKKVRGNFWCSGNELTSLEGALEYVGGTFECFNNKLTSLEGAPMEIGVRFYYLGNDDLPRYKVDAYKAYLNLSYSEKAPLTKDNHYYPTDEWENMFK